MNVLVARSMIIDQRIDRRTDRLRRLPGALYADTAENLRTRGGARQPARPKRRTIAWLIPPW